MSKWILPTILTAEDVVKLSDEMLELLTRISTGIVLKAVNDFVDKYSNSTDPTCSTAASKLAKAYKSVNDINAYLESEEAKTLADTLASLQYNDVSATTDLHVLKLYRELIIELLSEDEEFCNSYSTESVAKEAHKVKTAYTAKLDNENLETVLAEMDNAAHGEVVALSLISNIKKKKSLFKNSTYNVNKPTVLRKAIYKKDKLRNILHGLDFLIPRLESGQSPSAWRRI